MNLEEMIIKYELDGDDIQEFFKFKKKMNAKSVNWFEASMFLPDSFERDIKKRLDFVNTLQEAMTSCLRFS